MPSHVRVALPTDIAEELVRERVAVKPVFTRGSGVVDIISIGVEAINTGSAVVAIAMAGRSCRRLAQSFLARRREDEKEINLTITVGDEKQSLQVRRDDPDAEDRIVDFLLTTLSA